MPNRTRNARRGDTISSNENPLHVGYSWLFLVFLFCWVSMAFVTTGKPGVRPEPR